MRARPTIIGEWKQRFSPQKLSGKLTLFPHQLRARVKMSTIENGKKCARTSPKNERGDKAPRSFPRNGSRESWHYCLGNYTQSWLASTKQSSSVTNIMAKCAREVRRPRFLMAFRVFGTQYFVTRQSLKAVRRPFLFLHIYCAQLVCPI